MRSKSTVDANLESNSKMLSEVQEQLKKVQSKQDFLQLSSEVHVIAENAKRNFELYIADQDPDLEHVEKMGNELMQVDQVFSKLRNLGDKYNKDINSEDVKTLDTLKKKMGFNQDDKV